MVEEQQKVKEETTAAAETEAQAQAAAQAAEKADAKAQTEDGKAEAVDPKDAKLDAQAKEIQDLQNRLLRLQADFDNFRKRNNEEREQLSQFVTAQVSKEFLKVLDNFERAEESLKNSTDTSAIQVGMEKIHKQFEKALKNLSIEEIPAEGKPFDPNIHEAVMQGGNPDLPDESVDLVLEKGYKIGDKVIRHSKVRVVRNS
ncbi:MAG: nucleotide exchange factor GrpE [Acidaminococcus provencensis]|jgi:molecular chaperone GrpE|uniref:nucleotide exchange factor GrpE n=1 Tax=Acidaminococcus TaxID=904 RepID=UPI000E47D7F8|nr:MULTISPECIES: nucleotide exchange factor GrpE [Acidaminococcus]MCH4095849.1 nucleotide exchange factor GrpE [Acidaminococcus provencensis]RHK02441.1 nucleotide exchange factor GrpE [Acidaminococcus sp. AM05-11]